MAPASLKDTCIEVGLQWHTDHVCWYLDGRKLACQLYKWVANDGPDVTNQATVLLNLAVGGPWAGADGVDDARMPTEFDIDHVGDLSTVIRPAAARIRPGGDA